MYHSARALFFGMGLLACAACSSEEPQATPDPAAAAARCSACHQGPLALTSWKADQLSTRIMSIRSGATAHPPVDVDLTSDAFVAELARALTGT